MSLSFNLQFSEAPFPTGFAGDENAYAQQLVANLSATITGNFLTGQVGGSAPSTNIGPWANGNQWWFWNASLPTPAYQSEFTLLQRDYNSIINGDNQINQRLSAGTGIGASTANQYPGGDRWKYTGAMATGRATVNQQLAAITGGQFVNTNSPNTEYCYRITVTTPQASLAAGDHFDLSQLVEQQFARPLFNLPTSLGIALRASVTGTFCVSIADQALGESWVGECVVATANTWAFYPFPNIAIFPAGSNLGATDTAAAYMVRICAASGTTFNAGTNGAWSAANNVADPNQSNLFATNGNTLDFTLVQHQPGAIVTPFVFKRFDQSLNDCKRYWYKSYDYLVALGTVTNAGLWTGFYGSATQSNIISLGDTQMRIAPTAANITAYSPASGGAGRVLDTDSGSDTTGATATFTLISQRGPQLVTVGAGFTSTIQGMQFLHITMSAEL